jgi:hypothetical protein
MPTRSKGFTASVVGVAGSSSSKRSRKRRNADAGPRAVQSTRREERAARVAAGERQAAAQRRATVGRDDRRKQGMFGSLGAVGERPAGLFGGLPVSELLIFVGLIGCVVGFFQKGGPALTVGVVAIALGVIELTLREHWSGFRSHTTLLAAVPAVAIELIFYEIYGNLKNHRWIVIPAIPVFLISFWFLRKRFLVARQRRTVRPRG